MADARLKSLNATVCHYIIAAPATGARKLNYTTRYPSTRGQRWATLTRRTRKRVFKTVQRLARKQPLDVPVQKITFQLFVGSQISKALYRLHVHRQACVGLEASDQVVRALDRFAQSRRINRHHGMLLKHLSTAAISTFSAMPCSRETKCLRGQKLREMGREELRC